MLLLMSKKVKMMLVLDKMSGRNEKVQIFDYRIGMKDNIF